MYICRIGIQLCGYICVVYVCTYVWFVFIYVWSVWVVVCVHMSDRCVVCVHMWGMYVVMCVCMCGAGGDVCVHMSGLRV